jgi:pimeloyl-ACP methyl ester carboxylesterase
VVTKLAATPAGPLIAYDLQGTGPALVLICGILMNRARWHATGYVERLVDRFTVITMDPLGHGESDKPHDPAHYRADQLAAHTVAVLDAEGVDSAGLWGFSRGGFIAALTAWAVPERVDRLVLGSVSMKPTNTWPTDLVEALTDGDWASFWDGFPLPESVREYMQEQNDPVAIAAALAGGSGDINWRRFDPPTIGYVGDAENMVEMNRFVARQIGIPMAILRTGEHAQTFADSDSALSVVAPFL